MASPIVRNTSVFGVEIESTEGTFVAPSADTSYFQPLGDSFEMTPSREIIERSVINSSIGPTAPRRGEKAVSGSVAVEFRASGVEGGDVDFGPFLKSALGASRSISTNTTTKSSGNTGSVLQIEDADISKFNVGDIILVKQSGGHHPCAVTAKTTGTGTASITVSPAKASGTFSNSVVISKSTTYYTAANSHPSLSIPYYWANTVRQAAVGAKVTSLAIDNFSTGQIASFNIGFEGLSYTEVDGAAPHTPSYDSGVPPIILEAQVYYNGTAITLDQFSLSLSNTVNYQKAISSSNGKVGSRVTNRRITGSFNPYSDDTSVTYFDAFDAGTLFSLFIKAFTPSSTSGEITMGSCIGIYLPNCMITEYKKGDQDGLVIDECSFIATRGSGGTTEEMYLGFI